MCGIDPLSVARLREEKLLVTIDQSNHTFVYNC